MSVEFQNKAGCSDNGAFWLLRRRISRNVVQSIPAVLENVTVENINVLPSADNPEAWGTL